jgi:hypothetical protein
MDDGIESFYLGTASSRVARADFLAASRVERPERVGEVQEVSPPSREHTLRVSHSVNVLVSADPLRAQLPHIAILRRGSCGPLTHRVEIELAVGFVAAKAAKALSVEGVLTSLSRPWALP